jgi:UDP-N-acetylmuramoyl-L-alanyl-D-glutamate--2,6-diaminopimelate ligase
VEACEYDVAVFTNLTQDHLDYHHTMEEYKRAKSLLFSQLGNTFDVKHPKFAVLNADDPASETYKKSTAAHVITYGIDQEADIKAIDIEMTSSGTKFILQTFGEHFPMKIQLIGKFSIYNVLASVAAALVTGISIEQIIGSIENVKGVAGRVELVNAGQNFTVIVDYAHTPDSLENVLKTIQQFAKRKTFVVVGCGGDRDRTKRPLMAKIACQFATDPIFTSDNPRSEDPMKIIEDILKGVIKENYNVVENRRDAIKKAIEMAGKDDVIVLAGKGHEDYQILKDRTIHFDEKEIVNEIIKEINKGI